MSINVKTDKPLSEVKYPFLWRSASGLYLRVNTENDVLLSPTTNKPISSTITNSQTAWNQRLSTFESVVIRNVE